MSDTLSVKITADVVDLQAKLAIAKAEMASFSRDLNTAARSAASSGLTDTLKTQMTASAESLLKARSQVDALSGSLEKAGVNVRGIREINAALHDLASGNIGALPGTLALVAHNIGGLGIEGIAAVAGVAALSGALVELVEHENAAQAATERAEGAFILLSDNPAARDPAFLDYLDEVKEKIAALPGESEKSAGAIVAAMAQIKDVGKSQIDLLAAALPDLEHSTEGATKAVEDFARGWNDIKEKGGDLDAYIDKWVSGLQMIADRNHDANITSRSFFEDMELGAIGASGDVKTLADVVQQLDTSKIEAFAAAMKNALGSGGTVTPKGDPVADFRLQLDQMEAASKSSHIAMLQDAVQMWQGETQAAGLSAAQQREIATGLAEAQKELNSATAEAAKTASDKAAEAAKQAANKALEAQKQAAEQGEQIQKSQVDTEVQLGKIRIDGERSTLEAEVAAGKATADQKLATLKDLEEQEYALDHAALQNRLDTLDTSLANYKLIYQQTYSQIELLDAEHQQKLSQLDQQAVQDAKKAAQEQEKSFNTAFNAIDRDFDTMLKGVLLGTQTWQQAFQRMAGNLVLSMIESIAEMELKWAAHEAWKLALELVTDNAMTDAQIAQIAAGNVADNSVDIEPSVMKHAASAAAAVYDDVSQIPYVGWILAPPAAAAAFAAVSAFGSFDQGTNYVPNDMIALIHEGERIIPAADNARLMNGLGSQGGGAGAGGDNYTMAITINAMDTQTGAQFLKENAPLIMNSMILQARNGNSALRGALSPT